MADVALGLFIMASFMVVGHYLQKDEDRRVNDYRRRNGMEPLKPLPPMWHKDRWS